MGSPGWSHRLRHRAPLLPAAVASVVTAGVLLGLAVDRRATFDASHVLSGAALRAEKDAYRADLNALQRRSNAFAAGWIAAAGVGLTGRCVVVTW